MTHRSTRLIRTIAVYVAIGLLTLVAAAIALGGLATSGIAVAKYAVGGAIISVFVALGLKRMEYFVLLVLFIRPSLDILKSGSADSAAAPGSLLAVLFVVVSAFWLIAQRRAGAQRHPDSMVQRSLLVFGAAATLSLVDTANVRSTAADLIRTIAIVMMFFVVERILEHTRRPELFVGAILASAVAPLIIGFAGSYVGLTVTETKDGVSRVHSTFGLANPYAYYLVSVGIILVAIAAATAGRPRSLALAGAAITGVALLTTQVRGAWIAFAVGLIAIGFLAGRKILLGVLLVMAMTWVAVPDIASQFSNVSTTSAGNAVAEDSLTWRVRHWQAILPLANANPVTGVGLNTVAELAPDGTNKLAHNDYLRAYVELGVLGLGAFLCMLATMLMTSWRAWLSATVPTTRAVSLASFGVLLGLVVGGLSDNLMSSIVEMWPVSAIVACAGWALRHPSGLTSFVSPSDYTPSIRMES